MAEPNSDNLVQLSYSKFSCYYSKKNYLCNEPNWDQLSEKDRLFWNSFITGIKTNFKEPTYGKQPEGFNLEVKPTKAS